MSWDDDLQFEPRPKKKPRTEPRSPKTQSNFGNMIMQAGIGLFFITATVVGVAFIMGYLPINPGPGPGPDPIVIDLFAVNAAIDRIQLQSSGNAQSHREAARRIRNGDIKDIPGLGKFLSSQKDTILNKAAGNIFRDGELVPNEYVPNSYLDQLNSFNGDRWDSAKLAILLDSFAAGFEKINKAEIKE